MNILYLCDKKTYLTKMSRVRFHGIKALSKITNVHYSGVGWDDYNSELNVQENINNISKDKNINFDIVFAYKPLELKDFKNVTIPKAIRYNEMWDIDWTIKEIRESGSELVVCHHLNDCEYYKKMNIPNVKFVYVGHCAEKTIFKKHNTLQKFSFTNENKYDILFSGACNDLHYPLRSRFHKLSKQLSKKYRCKLHTHPGYKLNDAYTDKYLIKYAEEINNARIVLACVSKWGYRLGKYIEIPMCGSAAICGDIPYDKADDYSYVIYVNNNMSDQEIIDKISYYLDNEDKRLEKVAKGIEFASNYTQQHYAERLLKEIKQFI